MPLANWSLIALLLFINNHIYFANDVTRYFARNGFIFCHITIMSDSIINKAKNEIGIITSDSNHPQESVLSSILFTASTTKSGRWVHMINNEFLPKNCIILL